MSDDFRDIDVDLPIIGRRTLKWPTADHHMHKWLHLIDQVTEVVGYCQRRQVCVQAGGACGLWPLALSQYFDVVYTFEPHVPNFKALTANCFDAPNVIALNAALADTPGLISIQWDKGHEANLGAQYIGPNGQIPKMTVDPLGLPALDLLYLDIEGAEGLAINGAMQSIEKYRPVVVYEDRHHHRFGFSSKEIASLFLDLGYRRVSNLSRNDDAVMVP